MRITALLNPFRADEYGYHRSHVSTPADNTSLTSSNAMPRRHKIPKDAPIFSEGNKIVGHVNYPPYEAEGSQELTEEHDRFRVFPRGEIQKKGVRHIPYNSDKKDFLDKTGRDAFEMFQYTYRRPGDEKEYVVVWDYNVGLVRMTPFFKSLKFTKVGAHCCTVPAKALNQNPGMKDISYSITGGALVCQGYWMPYQAARAIAATFCYEIRWALTPVFGNDFPSMCLTPKDPSFAKFLIDPAIVRYCAAETSRFKAEGASYRLSSAHLLSPMETPKMSFDSPTWKPKANKTRRRRPADLEGGYGTDMGKNDCAFSPHVSPGWNHLNRPLSPASLSPQVSPRSHWTTLNGSSMPATPSTVNFSTMSSPVETHARPRLQIPTLRSHEHSNEQFSTKRTHSKVAFSDAWEEEPRPVRPQTAGAVQSNGALEMEDEDVARSQTEIEAAELLLSLGVGGSGKMLLPPTKRTRRGSTM
ncbi:hypothetical protein BDU57DRAFT_533706 [Ampelomyces quisqualis]|uniref:HTH APSES-type domain-containing protein n=1 Tax=Ampelomyces quisqualis TaxID=50730 RepID=A0A6A5Q6A8_AMPQU|nr:hypothetical protein BDU57DRAFT_533706 [Ampelomyces quisqualis]